MAASEADLKVIIVVINWNYGRFLNFAIESAAGQTYDNVRCIVVDNGSTDNSRDVIEAAQARYPQLSAIFLDDNLGHLGAILRIQHELDCDLVTFLDSDDMVVDSFAKEHVEALRSSGAGVSTNPIFHISEHGELLTGASSIRADLCTAASKVSENAWYVPPTLHGWFWSHSGSANMYRRSGLDFAFALQPRQPPVDYFGDTLLNAAAHALRGTAIVGAPLSFYRIHDANDGAGGVDLPGYRRLKRTSAERSVRQRTDLALSLLEGWPIPHAEGAELGSAFRAIVREPDLFLQIPSIQAALSQHKSITKHGPVSQKKKFWEAIRGLKIR